MLKMLKAFSRITTKFNNQNLLYIFAIHIVHLYSKLSQVMFDFQKI